MKKARKILFALLLVCILCSRGFLEASEIIAVQLRLYEGFKEQGKVASRVVSSYYLEQLPGGQILPAALEEKEKNSIKRIYNLEEVKEISCFDMEIDKGSSQPQAQEILLGGRKLLVTLAAAGKTDRFQVEVSVAGSGDNPLLETEIIIPQEKTAVLGFSDSGHRIFFLSFHRKKDRPKDHEGRRVASLQYPRLITRVEPVYPEQALEQGLEGEVVLKALIDARGDVTGLQVDKGRHPLLNTAAMAAVKQWKYRPWIVNGVPHPMEVYVRVTFILKEAIKKNKTSKQEEK